MSSDNVQSYDETDLVLSDLKPNLGGRALKWALGYTGRANATPMFFYIHSCNGEGMICL